MSTINEKSLVGETVASDYRAAAVFTRYGIDFCCKGGISIQEACKKKGVDMKQLLDEIQTISQAPASGPDFNKIPMDMLADYIEKVHHRYVNEKTPVIMQYLNKVVKVHADGNPELIEVKKEFDACAQSLAAHMKKEELILFPYIKRLAAEGVNAPQPGFVTAANPIAMMKAEHVEEGERFVRIAELTSGYTPPEYACNTYRVMYAMLKEFEADLHTHIHLENNILFPRALAVEDTRHTK